MSKFIKSIVSKLDNQPQMFYHINGDDKKDGEYWIKSNGLACKIEDLRIINYGNFPAPIISVFINGKEVPHTIGDAYRLEFAVKRWFKRISYQHLITN